MVVLKWTLALICVLLFSSAASAADHAGELQSQDPIAKGRAMLIALPGTVQNLLQYALNYRGVSYHRGGDNPDSGFDCSGFVGYVFDQVEGLVLPHSASAISQIGTRIKMSELQPGDLVFFHFMRNTVSHVGIYLGNDQFIHASSTRTGSVMVSSLNDSYWSKHFSLARHLDVQDRPLVEQRKQLL